MKTIIKCLLAQRSDGKFLRLDEQQHTTSYDFVKEPEMAKRIVLWGNDSDDQYLNPKEASYYLGNIISTRELRSMNCVMVCYEITTEVSAVKIQ